MNGKPVRGRWSVRRLALWLSATVALFSGHALAGPPLRIALSLSDVPLMWGAPDGGFEGVRFGGYTVFDALVGWDLSSPDKPPTLVPGLAESWSVDPAEPKRWVFRLRQAVFHDGTPWNADAAVWNLDSVLKPGATHFNPSRSGLTRTRTVSIASYGKLDDHTIFIETDRPNALLLYEIASLFFVSPTRFAEVGNDWSKFAQRPAGTGPYKVASIRPREQAQLEANQSYWDQKRVPKTERLVLIPVPDPNTRVSALRSGQVDIAETLPPDAIEPLKAAGFSIAMNPYPHTWLWRVNFVSPSPFADVRVRRAVNLAINRSEIVELLNATATPAAGFALPDSPWAGQPQFTIEHNPAKARELLKEAGYGPGTPLQLKVMISASGGGQILPLPMNEAIQQNLSEVGVNVSYEVADFTAMINMLRVGAKASGLHAINIAMTMQEPGSGLFSYESGLGPPKGSNWGFYDNHEFDAAVAQARAQFDQAQQDQAMARVNEILVQDAAAIVVVHDLNPRGVSPKVRGFVQARNWYQDYTSVRIEE